MQQTKILLDESDIPTHWHNVVADMPNPPAPPLGSDGKPIGPDARPLRLRLRRHRQAHAADADVTLGHDFMPAGIHAGGLRYHGDSALVSQLYHEKLIEAVAVPQLATFQAGVTFARAEGIIPAPESNHAIAACIDEALRCKQTGEAKTLFFNLSGHGHFDMGAYDKYFSGELEDFDYPEEAIKAALERLPKVSA
jgi:predicted alternative tryptophan synthase beta-subunit